MAQKFWNHHHVAEGDQDQGRFAADDGNEKNPEDRRSQCADRDVDRDDGADPPALVAVALRHQAEDGTHQEGGGSQDERGNHHLGQYDRDGKITQNRSEKAVNWLTRSEDEKREDRGVA